MNDEARDWLKRHGIECGEDGAPKRPASDRPPEPCLRCGTPVEGPLDAAVSLPELGELTGPVCELCFGLIFTGREKEFWGEGWGQKRGKE